MHTATVHAPKSDLKFPPFDLARLLKTTLNPKKGKKSAFSSTSKTQKT